MIPPTTIKANNPEQKIDIQYYIFTFLLHITKHICEKLFVLTVHYLPVNIPFVHGETIFY